MDSSGRRFVNKAAKQVKPCEFVFRVTFSDRLLNHVEQKRRVARVRSITSSGNLAFPHEKVAPARGIMKERSSVAVLLTNSHVANIIALFM